LYALSNSKVNRKSKDRQHWNGKEAKKQTKPNSELQTLQRKLKNKQHKPHNKIDDDASEG
jgi:hypothetical protein